MACAEKGKVEAVHKSCLLGHFCPVTPNSNHALNLMIYYIVLVNADWIKMNPVKDQLTRTKRKLKCSCGSATLQSNRKKFIRS